MNIRPETEADHASIENVNDQAFGEPVDLKVLRNRLAVDSDHFGGNRDSRISTGQSSHDQLAVSCNIEVQIELLDDWLRPVAGTVGVDCAHHDREDRKPKE